MATALIAIRPRAVALIGGRIIVSGGEGIYAFTATGAQDPTYADHGFARTGIDSWRDQSAFDVLADGGVVVGGSDQVIRLTGAGAITWSTRLGFSQRVVAVAAQPDGKVAVLVRNTQVGYGIRLLRLNGDGSMDATFSNSTWLVNDPLRGDPSALLRLPGGGFLVGARTMSGAPHRPAAPEVILAGFTPLGQLDPAFGTGGVTRTPMPDVERGVANVLRLSDGRIIAVGVPDPSITEVASLVRYLPDGRLDTSFGSGGVARVTGVDPRMAALTSGGQVLVAGGTIGPWDIGVVRARPADASAPGAFHPMNPVRVLDTRSGLGAPAAKLGPGAGLSLKVAGQGGVPADGVSAVVVNMTATGPTHVSFITAWPTGRPRPHASNVNVGPGQTVANLVVVQVGEGGRVDLYNHAGSVDLVADLAGWYGTDGTGSGAGYTPLVPARILDTRPGLGAPAATVGAASTVALQVTGRGGVPASGVSAVVLNVTATEPTAVSFLTTWPAGTARPLASSMNYTAGQTVPNLVMVKVGAGGVVNLYNNGGSVHLIADVAGWYGREGGGTGTLLSPVVPARILDTRTGQGAPAAKVAEGSMITVQVAGQGGVPASGVSAVVMNITVTEPTALSFLTAWPAGEARPHASNLNYLSGQTTANLVVVKVGDGGRVNLYNSLGAAHVVADVAGWYGG